LSTLVPVGEVRIFEKQTHLIDPMGDQTSVLWQAWYAVYTRSRFEQVVKKQLDFKGINSFLPLYSKISQWKDRRKVVSWPLFPGYLFVQIAANDRLNVQKSVGVVNIVGNQQGPLEVSEQQITAIRTFIETGLKYDPHPYLKVGKKVRVTDGPLAGLEGILVRKKNRSLFVISVEMIQRSVSVELESWKIESS
jgi:transcription termination/antitermination protein NusG